MKSIFPAWISFREALEDMYGPRLPMNGAIGPSTSSESEAPLKRPILVSGACCSRWRARAGMKVLGSPVLVKPLMAIFDRSPTSLTASSTGTSLSNNSLHCTRSVKSDMICSNEFFRRRERDSGHGDRNDPDRRLPGAVRKRVPSGYKT